MSKQAEDVDTAKEIARLNDTIRGLERKIKGYKGREARLNPKGSEQKPESSPEVPVSSQTESPQVAPLHVAPSWMKDCPECGGPNPLFKGKPNVFCVGPECGGRIPLGHVDIEDIKKRVDAQGHVDLPEIKKCYNCGAEGDALQVRVVPD